jgi:hypothetical protein
MGLFRRRADSGEGPLLSAGLQEKDLSVLDALRDSGARLDEPRHVLHYLYFPSQRAAEQAAATAKSQGWEAAAREPLVGIARQWSVVAQRDDAVLEPRFVRESTAFFESLAAVHHGEYDGWEAGT